MVAAAFGIGIGVGGATKTTSQNTTANPVTTATAAQTQAGPGTVPTTQVAVPAPTTPTQAAPPPPPTVEDGTWTVGTDLPAGKYRTTANVDPSCYWAILKSGTNGDQIIANDIPGGGRPTVTLKAGEDFKTQDCGTWLKIG